MRGARNDPRHCHECGNLILSLRCEVCGRLHGVTTLNAGRRLLNDGAFECRIHGPSIADPFCSEPTCHVCVEEGISAAA